MSKSVTFLRQYASLSLRPKPYVRGEEDTFADDVADVLVARGVAHLTGSPEPFDPDDVVTIGELGDPDSPARRVLAEFGGTGAGVTDHGLLTGRGDDDHPQYLNQARGDARYPLAGDVAAALADKATTGHLHTAAQVSDFVEAVQDAVAGLLGAGSNITLNYNDTAGTLSIAAATGDSFNPEAVRDAMGIALVGVGNIAIAVNDAADTITVSTTATANATDAFLLSRGNHTGTQAIGTVTGLQAALDARLPSQQITQAAMDALIAAGTTTAGTLYVVVG